MNCAYGALMERYWQEGTEVLIEKYISATPFTTNPTWTRLVPNRGLLSFVFGKPEFQISSFKTPSSFCLVGVRYPVDTASLTRIWPQPLPCTSFPNDHFLIINCDLQTTIIQPIIRHYIPWATCCVVKQWMNVFGVWYEGLRYFEEWTCTVRRDFPCRRIGVGC